MLLVSVGNSCFPRPVFVEAFIVGLLDFLMLMYLLEMVEAGLRCTMLKESEKCCDIEDGKGSSFLSCIISRVGGHVIETR